MVRSWGVDDNGEPITEADRNAAANAAAAEAAEAEAEAE
jgi:hypothetical protein